MNRLEQMVKRVDPTVTEIQYAFSVKTDKPSPLHQKRQVLTKSIGYSPEQYKEAYLERLVETPKVWEQQKQVEQVKIQARTKEQDNELSL